MGEIEPGSFRDPSGFVFFQQGVPYRQINQSYRADYDRLMDSGLYAALVEAGWLLPHAEASLAPPDPLLAYKVIQPEPISFVSYPYEWCFSQWKQAALTTLQIQKMALEHGMSLKDASAYNIQFHKGRPVFIDTLSFETYREGEPWVAYRQFCEHFAAPLALMSHVDIRMGRLSLSYFEGMPLDLASALLPFSSRFDLFLTAHIRLHAKSQIRHAATAVQPTKGGMSARSLLGLIDHLEGGISKLTWQPAGTEWADYYQDTNYSPSAFEQKRQIVAQYIEQARPASVWDMGANTGLFSRLASERGIPTIAFDIDPAAVERNYLDTLKNKETALLPLLMDASNPTPGIGWANRERHSLRERGPTDMVLALALVHHLAISNNVPLLRIAEFFQELGRTLVIEFVPKADSQVQRLLASRKDIFTAYDQEHFEQDFRRYFEIEASTPVQDSQRTLYLMRRKQAAP